MARKRARLGEDNDPLTSTDKVLQGFEELSKSTSQESDKSVRQEVEDKEANKTNKSTSRQVKKSTSQPASKSTIRQARRKKTSTSNTSTSKQVNKLTSQQDENIDSQEVVDKIDSKSTSQQASKSKSQQDENTTSQEVSYSNESNKPGSQQVSNKVSQQDDENVVNEVDDEINSKPTSQEANKSKSQQVSSKASQEVNKNRKESDKLANQQANKLVIRKSTFQLTSSILEQLDRLHLELQLELGKQDAPYKEVIVEEAIAQFLEVAAENRSELVEALLERQSQRK